MNKSPVAYKWRKLFASRTYGGKKLELSPEAAQELIDDIENEYESLSPDDCTRVEIIDGGGRVYVNDSPNNKIWLDVQDEGKTIKIFIAEKLTPPQH